MDFNKYLSKNDNFLLTFERADDIIVIKEIMVMRNIIKRNIIKRNMIKKNLGDGKCDKKSLLQAI